MPTDLLGAILQHLPLVFVALIIGVIMYVLLVDPLNQGRRWMP